MFDNALAQSVKSLIEPDVSTGRVRSNEFRVCWRGLSLTHCLGDFSGAFLLLVGITAALWLEVRGLLKGRVKRDEGRRNADGVD